MKSTLENKSVLCVDGEVNVLNAIKRLLRKEPYHVFYSDNSLDALEILKNESINLVICDYQMPEMNGVELLEKARELQPDAVRVILSGYAEIHAVIESINQGEVYRFIAKPWEDEDLKQSIVKCLEQYDLLQQNKLLTEELKQKNLELERANKKLEQTVEFRTNTLQNTQNIVEQIPVPILGIGDDGVIVMSNMSYAQHFAEILPSPIGMNIAMVFPESLSEKILRGNNSSFDCLTESTYINECPITVYVKQFNQADNSQGYLMAIERKQAHG